ncbi:MAG: hypothetical protein GY711_34145 [bacterium]|nr:hypothetical protein [bacterium]
MIRSFLLALASSVVLALGGATPAGGAPQHQPSFAAARAAIETDIVPRLAELAHWCHDRRLFGDRDRLWSGVLRLEPGNSDGRRILRYRRSGDGWLQSKSYKLGVNRNPRAVPEFTGRYRRVVGDYKLRLFKLLSAHRKDPEVGPEVREDVLGHLLLIDPDDLEVRTALGETWHEGRWILAESQRTLRGRADLALFARAAMEWAPEPQAVEATEAERDLGLELRGAHATSAVRVLGTTDSVETKATARLTHAAEHYFEHVFRLRQTHRDGFTVFLLSGFGEREALLKGFGVPEPRAALARQSAGGWLTPTVVGQWSSDPRRRLDGAARQTLGAMLMDAYGIDGRHGWAWEGVGLYLVYNLTGTRMTYFFEHSDYQKNRPITLWPRLQNPATDWLAEGRALLAGPKAPKLEFLLGRNVNLMRDEDMLMGYVLAAYLLEGWPREAPGLLRRIGSGEHPIESFESGLGYSLRQIERRLARWLEETRKS